MAALPRAVTPAGGIHDVAVLDFPAQNVRARSSARAPTCGEAIVVPALFITAEAAPIDERPRPRYAATTTVDFSWLPSWIVTRPPASLADATLVHTAERMDSGQEEPSGCHPVTPVGSLTAVLAEAATYRSSRSPSRTSVGTVTHGAALLRATAAVATWVGCGVAAVASVVTDIGTSDPTRKSRVRTIALRMLSPGCLRSPPRQSAPDERDLSARRTHLPDGGIIPVRRTAPTWNAERL